MVRKILTSLQSNEGSTEGDRPSPGYLAANGVLAIIAGSDTTATALAATLFYILRHPTAYQRLKEEVAANFAEGEEPTDVSKLAKMEWLNGCL